MPFILKQWISHRGKYGRRWNPIMKHVLYRNHEMGGLSEEGPSLLKRWKILTMVYRLKWGSPVFGIYSQLQSWDESPTVWHSQQDAAHHFKGKPASQIPHLTIEYVCRVAAQWLAQSTQWKEVPSLIPAWLDVLARLNWDFSVRALCSDVMLCAFDRCNGLQHSLPPRIKLRISASISPKIHDLIHKTRLVPGFLLTSHVQTWAKH